MPSLLRRRRREPWKTRRATPSGGQGRLGQVPRLFFSCTPATTPNDAESLKCIGAARPIPRMPGPAPGCRALLSCGAPLRKAHARPVLLPADAIPFSEFFDPRLSEAVQQAQKRLKAAKAPFRLLHPPRAGPSTLGVICQRFAPLVRLGGKLVTNSIEPSVPPGTNNTAVS